MAEAGSIRMRPQFKSAYVQMELLDVGLNLYSKVHGKDRRVEPWSGRAIILEL